MIGAYGQRPGCRQRHNEAIERESAMGKERFAIVGVGSRSGMYLSAVMDTFAENAELVGACDANLTRMGFQLNRHRERHDYGDVPMYHAADFDQMLAETQPNRVIVTSMDRTHHDYICRALNAGCDVVTEKPMTTDAAKCQQIVDTVKATGRHVTVTFNYRYAPLHTKVKELLRDGTIGDVTSVHFEWVLNTRHGADYFRRWHRDKANSGGLLVHKSTHHFDLVNWWLDSAPAMVFARGKLAFYGRQNAETRGMRQFYMRATGNETAQNDPFALHLDKDENLSSMYLDAEHEDGYQRDQSVFGYNISIEDNMALTVEYESGALMSYSLNAHSPWEGYRCVFNGTKGRLELDKREAPYVSGAKDDTNLAENRADEEPVENSVPEIVVQRHWEQPFAVSYEQAVGGHGGGDIRMLRHVFEGADDDPLGLAAGFEDGAMSILTGIAGNRSMASGMPVQISDLVSL
jgi:predicted dehydrogenase